MSNVDGALRTLSKSGSLLFVGIVFELIISLAGKLVLARYLDVSSFGVVSLGLTVLTVLGAISILGLDEGIVRNFPRYTNARATGIIKSSFIMGLFSSVIFGLGVYILAKPIAITFFKEPRLVGVLQIYAFFVPLAAILRLSMGATRAANRTLPKVVVRNFSMPLSRLIFVVGATIASFGLLGTAFFYVLPMLIGGLLAIYFAAQHTPLLQRGDWRRMFSSQLRFSAPLMVASSVSFVLGNADTFMIGYFMSSAAVGIYGIAYTIAPLLNVFSRSLGYLGMPIFSDIDSKNETQEFQSLLQVLTKWMTLATLPLFVVVFLFPTEVIAATFGVKYADGALPLRVLSVGFLFRVLLATVNSGIKAIGNTKLVMKATVLSNVVNVILNFFMIPIYDITGAAIATVTSFVVLDSILAIGLYYERGVHPFSKRQLSPLVGIIPIAAGFGLIAEPNATIPSLLGYSIIFGLIYILTTLFFGAIGDEELMIIRSIESKYDINLGPVAMTIERFQR